MTDKVVQQYNERQMQTLKKDLPKFRPGDTLSIQSRITEGTRERLQTFKGVLIAQRRAGIHSSVTLRAGFPKMAESGDCRRLPRGAIVRL